MCKYFQHSSLMMFQYKKLYLKKHLGVYLSQRCDWQPILISSKKSLVTIKSSKNA